jgi:ribosome modulation factor
MKDLYMDQCEAAYDVGYYDGYNGMPRAACYMSKRDDTKGAYVDGYSEGQYFRIKGWKDTVCQN